MSLTVRTAPAHGLPLGYKSFLWQNRDHLHYLCCRCARRRLLLYLRRGRASGPRSRRGRQRFSGWGRLVERYLPLAALPDHRHRQRAAPALQINGRRADDWRACNVGDRSKL